MQSFNSVVMKDMKGVLVWAVAALQVACSAQTLRPQLEIRAIVGARIQISPDKVMENGTVLIRGTLISEVGEHIQVPKGAEVIDGKGLTVYAGFIDGYSSKGLKVPERPRQDVEKVLAEDVVLQMRNSAAGIRAELSGADVYNPDDDAWKAYRSSGFTAAAIVPSTGVIVGQASLIELDGRPRRDSVISPTVGLAIQFQGSGGQYPGTVLGAYATARQAFFDANRLALADKGYKLGSSYRPEDEPALRALWQQEPLLIGANSMPEMDRAMDFAAEFKRPALLIGGAESWRIVDRLQKDSAGVILSLAFGEEPLPAKKPAEKKEEPKETAQHKDDKGPEENQDPLEKRQEQQRKWLEKVGSGAALAKAKIPFAFTTSGTKDANEFLENLRRAIKEGLSNEDAIAGLTSNAAKLFGVERIVGTVEPGKLANLTVLSGDFSLSDSKVKLVFIEGLKIDPSKTPFKYSPAPRFGSGE
jgi:hypothetical protein